MSALYRDLTVADHLVVAGHYRASFDRPQVLDRLRGLGIPLSAQVGSLSGGQTAQLGLTLAFGLDAEILLLDEPLASLDPLARAEVLTLLEELTRETGATVVLSSHLIEDITQVCDHLIVLGAGRVLLHDSIATAVRTHTLAPEAPTPSATRIASMVAGGPARTLWRVEEDSGTEPASITDVVLGYLSLGRSTEVGMVS
jgi:ABC-2 type transport system ATP-binding protein